MTRLRGSIIVTGGGSGIGRACAIYLAARGAIVVAADIDEAGLDATVAEIVAAGGTAEAVHCDVRDEAQVKAAVDRAAELDTVSGLVTCAGIVLFASTHECSLDDWQRVIDVNLTGTFLAVKHTIPRLLEAGGGAIVTIGSTSAVVAGNIEADPGYKASKGGVLQLTKLVAAQYGGAGVRANCLCPGPIMTQIVESGGADSGNVDTFARLAADLPLGRGGRPEEVASVAAFLLSDESSFMTGATVMADGGFTAV